jgi:tetratricopeptide (TPR) repeat protein
MAPGKKLTKLAKIGLSHNDRAKAMAAKGMYSEALSELKIALFSLRSENRDGTLNDDIAGVLNSIGSVNLLLKKYAESAEAFSEATAIRRPMYNNPEVGGSLIGMSEAYRCICDFGRATECLEEALQVALSLKNDKLAARVMDATDMLERTRDNKPAHDHDTRDDGDLYLPPELEGVHAVLRNLELNVSPEIATISLVLGFPGQDKNLYSRSAGAAGFPCAAVLLGNSEDKVDGMTVIDEEEEPVDSAVTPFQGLIFVSGSYHRHGPKPMPACKKLTYAGGAGALLRWKIDANGWYRAEIGLKLKDVTNGFKFAVVLPYRVKMSRVLIDVGKPLEYGMLRIDEGTFHTTGSTGRIAHGQPLSYALKRRLFEGSAFGALDIETNTSMKYAVIAIELVK